MRLLNIVSDNVVRLNRMIEDILKLSRKAHPQNEPLSARAASCRELVTEFRETHALGARDHRNWAACEARRCALIHCICAKWWSICYRMRCATPAARDACIRIRAVAAQPDRMELHVQDDGPAIHAGSTRPPVRAFLHYVQQGHRSGLYLARELCLNNGAMLDYEYRMDFRGMAPRSQAADS